MINNLNSARAIFTMPGKPNRKIFVFYVKTLLSLSLILYSQKQLLAGFATNEQAPYNNKSTLLASQLEERCFIEINKVREAELLKPLKKWKKLAECARKHSENMAQQKCAVGHEGFHRRFEKMKKQGPLTHFGENVAYCYGYQDPVALFIKGWMNSKGHRKNILGDFSVTGIAVSITEDGKIYITQLFGQLF